MAELRYIAPEQLTPWPGLNPRTHFPDDVVAELTESVRSKGVLQPLLVHWPDDPNDDEGLGWIVAGR